VTYLLSMVYLVIDIHSPMYLCTGQSACLACSFGIFSPSPIASLCTPCPSSSVCLFGSAAPIASAKLGDPAATGSVNPFNNAMGANRAGLTQLLSALGSTGAVLVVLILAVATAAHVHPRARQLVLGDTPARAQTWASLDFIFSFVHFTPKGNVMRRRGTSFGGMVTVACSVAIVILSAMLATKNLLNPNYIQSVSADALPANPAGTFCLRTRVFGGGMAFSSAHACDGMAIVAQHDWMGGLGNTTRPAVAASVADGRSCLLEWRCDQCHLSGSVSSTVLTLRSALPSWATFVNFTFEAPSFVIAGASPTAAAIPAAVSSGIDGAGLAFSTFGYISPQPAALRGTGEDATQVAISLIGVDAQTRSGERAVAFSALVGSIVTVGTTSETAFDFGSPAGFQIDFNVQRSQTVIKWCARQADVIIFCVAWVLNAASIEVISYALICSSLLTFGFQIHCPVFRKIDDGALFNVMVLIGSLISTVVVAFTMVMRTLEEYCGISTNEPNKHVVGDSISSASGMESTTTTSTDANASASIEKAAASAISAKASTQYVDFDNDVCGDAHHEGGRNRGDVDDGSMMGARPFHGNVVVQSSNCAIEMQNVSKSQPISSMPSDGGAATLSSHQGRSAIDRDSQVMSMLADIQRQMHEQATRTDAQLAFLTAQMARSEADHAALKADLAHSVQLQDQKHQQSAQSMFQLEQWIRESRAAAAPEATADDATF
jgi:hypothetical protein